MGFVLTVSEHLLFYCILLQLAKEPLLVQEGLFNGLSYKYMKKTVVGEYLVFCVSFSFSFP